MFLLILTTILWIFVAVMGYISYRMLKKLRTSTNEVTAAFIQLNETLAIIDAQTKALKALNDAFEDGDAGLSYWEVGL